MPYYLESDDRVLLKKLRLTNVCEECGERLEVFYDLQKHLPYLQCKSNPEHQGIARPPSRYEMGGLSELNIPTRRAIMKEAYGEAKTQALEKYQGGGQLTKEGAMEVLKLVYPRCPEAEIIRTAMLCRDFGLHPLMKEVYLISFKRRENGRVVGEDWATVIGITANRKIASAKKGAFSFLDDTPRAASKEEIVKQYGAGSDEERANIISICRLKGEKGNTALGFGLYPKDKEPYGTDKGNTPRNMANIRAERQALDRLPGEAMPLKGFDVIDEAYAQEPAPTSVTVTTESGEVDTGTGEIVESKATVIEGKPEHWCAEHNCEYDRKVRGSSVWYAHKNNGGWCNEIKPKAKAETPVESPLASSEAPAEITTSQLATLKKLKDSGSNLSELIKGMGFNITKIGELTEAQAQTIIDAETVV